MMPLLYGGREWTYSVTATLQLHESIIMCQLKTIQQNTTWQAWQKNCIELEKVFNCWTVQSVQCRY